MRIGSRLFDFFFIWVLLDVFEPTALREHIERSTCKCSFSSVCNGERARRVDACNLLPNAGTFARRKKLFLTCRVKIGMDKKLITSDRLCFCKRVHLEKEL